MTESFAAAAQNRVEPLFKRGNLFVTLAGEIVFMCANDCLDFANNSFVGIILATNNDILYPIGAALNYSKDLVRPYQGVVSIKSFYNKSDLITECKSND